MFFSISSSCGVIRVYRRSRWRSFSKFISIDESLLYESVEAQGHRGPAGRRRLLRQVIAHACRHVCAVSDFPGFSTRTVWPKRCGTAFRAVKWMRNVPHRFGCIFPGGFRVRGGARGRDGVGWDCSSSKLFSCASFPSLLSLPYHLKQNKV